MMLPKEKTWVKQDLRKSGDLLQISPNEWAMAHKAVAFFATQGKHPPYKLSRKELQKLYPEHFGDFNHSLLVVPIEPPPETGPSYRIGIMARSKVYINATGKAVTEGILGYGSFGEVKLIQWEGQGGEPGEIDAVKIEGDIEGLKETRAIETQIMKDLGYLRAEFVRVRSEPRTEKTWISGREIHNMRYTVQQRHVGIEMRDYFSNPGLTAVIADPQTKYKFGLQSALAIKALHDRNTLHLDIKPANFLVNIEGTTAMVTAIDFGFSIRLKEGQTKVQGTVTKGTPLYVAPEIVYFERDVNGRVVVNPQTGWPHRLSEQRIYSKAADVFSLGIMFRDDLKLGELSSEFAAFIKRMTAHNPEDRPTMDEVVVFMQTHNPEMRPPTHEDKLTVTARPLSPPARETTAVVTTSPHEKQQPTSPPDKFPISDILGSSSSIEDSWYQRREATAIAANTKEYEKLYGMLYKYMAGKKASKKPSWLGMDSKKQIGMANDLKKIIEEYQSTTPQSDEKTSEAADKILSIMKENQKRHEKTFFAAASKFNATLLRKLPKDLRKSVCDKLEITEDDDILSKNVTYSARKKLAEIVSSHELPASHTLSL